MWNRNKAATYTALAVVIIITARLAGCSVPGPSPSPEPAPPADVTCEGGLHVGDVKQEICEDAISFEKSVCGADGKLLVVQACPVLNGGGDKDCDDVVTFDELQPVIQTSCLGSCHSGWDNYDTAKRKFAGFKARITSSGADRMPKGGQLATADKNLFLGWERDGFLKAGECDTAGGNGGGRDLKSFTYLEQTIAADLINVDVNDQPDTRYLVSLDRINAGATDEELAEYRVAADKGTNLVSLGRDIYPVAVVAPGIYRVNIDELEMSAEEWQLIENADKLQIESQTSLGKFLKDTTKSRLPWMYVDTFNDDVLQNSAVYYALLNIPTSLVQYELGLGVDFQGDLRKTEPIQGAFNGSRLSPQANRLVDRHESDDGFFWITFDTGKIVSDRQNMFKNPCLVGSGCNALLTFAASETLASLPNGLWAAALWNAQGLRLNAADERVVHDYTNAQTAPTIINSLSCWNCHSGGLIHFVDQIRPLVTGPGNQFKAADAQIIKALFKPQSVIDQALARDNGQMAEEFGKLGVDFAKADPITGVSNRFLGEWDLSYLCNKLFLPNLNECKSQLNLSQAAKDQLGQLLSGGTATHDQVVQVLKQVIIDLRLFQDPL